MFDFMIKILDNGRILVRDTSQNEVTNMKPTDFIKFIEDKLETQLQEEETNEAKIEAIKKELSGESTK